MFVDDFTTGSSMRVYPIDALQAANQLPGLALIGLWRPGSHLARCYTAALSSSAHGALAGGS
jgi:hypothetical protein